MAFRDIVRRLNWPKLRFEFDLNHVQTKNNKYSGLPQLIGNYNFDSHVGAIVKFDYDQAPDHMNPNINLIIHCLTLEKKTLEQLQPEKCIKVKITSYIYNDERFEKFKMHHVFDPLSFRMESINKYIEFKEFTDCQFLSQYTGSKLVVELKFTISKVVYQINSQPLSLGKLLLDPIHSDVDLVVDGHVFKAHKAVLAARCEYFEKMFNADMKEQQENRVEIKAVDKDVFKWFLDYIYTGKIIGKFDLKKLLVLADEFQTDDLKTVLADFMINQLNLDNAILFLALADEINHKKLKSAAIEFISRNKSQV